jgi:NAD(P)-dependent dehydrogenase (short-subunit alcohol dehydrogenase family)
MEKIWFITGSSRGLGRSLTEAVLANGDKVAATARNPQTLNDLVEKYPDQIYPVKLDVTDYTEVKHAVADAITYFGKIDVLVNNAGFGIIGAAEAFTDEQVLSQLEPIYMHQLKLPARYCLSCASNVQGIFCRSAR